MRLKNVQILLIHAQVFLIDIDKIGIFNGTNVYPIYILRADQDQ